MCLEKRHNNPEGMGWKFSCKGCRKEVTLRKETFFEGKMLIKCVFKNIEIIFRQ